MINPTGAVQTSGALDLVLQGLRKVSAGAPLAEVLDAICRGIEAIDPEVLCSILVYDEQNKRLHHGAGSQLPTAYVEAIDGIRISPKAGSCGTAAYRREVVVVSDIAADPLWQDYRELALTHGLRACWSTPIFSREGRLLGTFAIYYRQAQSPRPEHQQLVDFVTPLTSIVIELVHFEESLRRREAELAEAYRISHIGRWTWDISSRSVKWPDEFFRLEGLSSKDSPVTDDLYRNRIHPDDRERVRQAFEQGIQDLCPFDLQFRVRPQDGSLRFHRIRGEVTIDDSDQPVVMTGTVQDVTDIVQMKEKLIESEEKYRELFENFNDVLFTTDLSGKLTSVNAAGERLTGYLRTESQGWGISQLVAPEYRERALDMIKKKLASGGGTQYELEIIAKDGHRIPLEFNTQVMFRNGVPFAIQGIARDITERKQAEAARLETERNYRTLFENSQDAIIITARDGRVVDVNQAALKLFGYCREEITKFGIRKVYANARDRKKFQNQIEDRGFVQDYEVKMCRKDGTAIDCVVSAAVHRSGHGGIDCYQSIFRDITARKRAEKSLLKLSSHLLHAQEEERSLLARELHDTTAQALFALTMNLASLGKMSPGLKPRIRKTVIESQTLADRCLNEVRDLSYLLHPPFLAQKSLPAVLRAFVEGFTTRSGCKVNLRISGNLGRLSKVVQMTVFRVVQESLLNAYRHSGSRAVRIRVARIYNRIEIEVADSGRGIPRRVLKKGSGAPGLGVGIVGMRERVEQLGGHLTIRSSSAGTTVRAFVPHPERQT